MAGLFDHCRKILIERDLERLERLIRGEPMDWSEYDDE
jgi:hypothetical protein